MQASVLRPPSKLEYGLLLAGFLAMYIPTYVTLDRDVWSVVGQGHGPVMVALTLWLAKQRWPALMALDQAPGNLTRALGFAAVLLGLAMYVLGRSQNHNGLDAGSQIPLFTGLLLMYGGWPAVKLMALPLVFVITVVPLPGSVVAALTGPLKSGVSVVAEHILHWLDYPIGRAGVTLVIGPYKLLVADACAGLNSIFALEAIGVFYLSLQQHTERSRNVILALLILPISFASNVLRVIALVLITYYFGDEVGQGFVHEFAGIFLMVVATVLTIATDTLLGLTVYRRKRAA
ncbi:exosortase B [Aquabacterium sp.]|uniref:exosortase B n=1 Tax=Aquabacterium sp. TaxID=1872578 RepID=UPI0035C765AB